MKLQPQDLRIGNFVEHNNYIFRIYSIISPSPDRNERFNNKTVLELWGNGLISVPINEIKPIPLTEELIIERGFEKDKYFGSINSIYCFENIGVDFDYVSDAISVFIYRGHSGWIRIAYIKHMHEFQNLYYELTGGKELKIK